MAVAAYASVISVMHVLDDLHHHPVQHQLHDPIMKQLETLEEKFRSLQDFLEARSPEKLKEIYHLGRQIVDVAEEAKDVIDVHVEDLIRCGGGGGGSEVMDLLASFRQDVEKVIETVDSIEKVLATVEEEKSFLEQPQLRDSIPSTGSSTLPPSGKNTMVGFDGHLERIMDMLTNHQSDLRVIPIVGMGGIGKTTLALNAFEYKCVVETFQIRMWFTVSQEYSPKEILSGLLHGKENKESNETIRELGERLYKQLFGKTFLIVMDDVWSVKVWDELKSFFPNNGTGSRIMLTTRFTDVAASLGSGDPYLVGLLDDDKSWELFSEKAFAQESYSPELEEIGKKIVKGCDGLPLAIIVIGGLLAQSTKAREFWESVAKNVSSFANTAEDDHSLKILALSYDCLPIHLKPCFLYMSRIPEDRDIRASELIKLWVAEGFLKPTRGKSLEEVAEGYLKDLVMRNLIHDLLRDLTLRESGKEQLFCVPYTVKVSENRCFICGERESRADERAHVEIHLDSRSTSLVSPMLCKDCDVKYPNATKLRLVRGRMPNRSHPVILDHQFLVPTKSRLIEINPKLLCESLSLPPVLWHLQTLYDTLFSLGIIVFPGIWEMPQLRLVRFKCLLVLHYPEDVPDGIEGRDFRILDKLLRLSIVYGFRCTEGILKRIPNLMKLGSWFVRNDMEWSYYSLHNLVHLHKLESLFIRCHRFIDLKKDIAFPESLKKLTLEGCEIRSEDLEIVGSLPNLQKLKLHDCCLGTEWNPTEGQFQQLKSLILDTAKDLQLWRADKFHFPTLEILTLAEMRNLEEFPLGIGDIDTLRTIKLINCSNSVIDSAKAILEEQRSLGNDDLQIHTFNYYR